jgi:hypothetical protein
MYAVTFSQSEMTLLLEVLTAIPTTSKISKLRERLKSAPPNPHHDEEQESVTVTGSPQQATKKRSQAPCRRNGKALPAQVQWKASEYVGQASNISARALLATLSTANFSSASHNPGPWLLSIRDALNRSQGNQACNDSDRPSIAGNQDLPSIVWRCASYRSKEVGMTFLAMLSLIQLAFKIER